MIIMYKQNATPSLNMKLDLSNREFNCGAEDNVYVFTLCRPLLTPVYNSQIEAQVLSIDNYFYCGQIYVYSVPSIKLPEIRVQFRYPVYTSDS